MRRLDDVAWDGWQPVDRATLVFVVRDGQVLLMRKKRGLGAGKINGPGGRIEPGETPHGAAAREVHEELGVEVAAERLRARGELWFQFADGYSIWVAVFRADECRGKAIETPEGAPRWTDLDQIPYAEMWADDVHWLPLLLEDRCFQGRFLFDGDTLLDHALRELEHPPL